MSIKSIADNYPDRRYLTEIFLKLSSGRNFKAYVSRPNYPVQNLIIKLKGSLSENEVSVIGKDFFELSFKKNGQIGEQLSSVLSQIWFAYEHVSFVFFDDDFDNIEITRRTWYEVTSLSSCFMAFKGVEDDVVWIAKSDNLTFKISSLDFKKSDDQI